jgi:YVTN family beta-propeller protein
VTRLLRRIVLAALAAALTGAPSARAASFVYVTSEYESAVSIVDGDLDAMVGAIFLSIGTADIAISPDGRTAYVADESTDSLAQVDLATGAVVRRTAVGNAPRRVVLDAAGAFAYVVGVPTVQVDLANGGARIATEAGLVRDVAVSADGRHAYFAASFAADRTFAGLSVVDTVTGETRTAAPDFWAGAVALSPDERVVYLIGNRASYAEGRILILDANSLAILADTRISDHRLEQLIVAPDGTALFTLESGDIAVIDPANGMLRARIDAPAPLVRLALGADGATLYATYNAFARHAFDIAVIDPAAGRVTHELVVGDSPVAMAARQGRLYVAARDGLFAVDTASYAVATAAPGAIDPTGIAASPDGGTLYVAANASGNLAVVDVAERRLVRSIATGGRPLGVVVAPDGRRAYVSSFTAPGTVFIVDTATLAIIDAVPLPGAAGGITITPDGSRVLVSNFDYAQLSVIATATGAVTHHPVGFSPKGIAISRDGRHGVVAVDLPSGIQLFDPATLQLGASLDVSPGYATQPCGVALRADGARAYATHYNGSDVQLIDTQRPAVIASRNIAAPYGIASCGIALTPDESRVYVANHDNDLLTVLDAGDLHLVHHIPVLRRPYEVAIACPGGCSTVPPTPTATPSPTPTVRSECAGDCGGDQRVTVADLIQAVSVALGRSAITACAAADGNGDGRVTIAELVGAVGAALGGCTTEVTS